MNILEAYDKLKAGKRVKLLKREVVLDPHGTMFFADADGGSFVIVCAVTIADQDAFQLIEEEPKKQQDTLGDLERGRVGATDERIKRLIEILLGAITGIEDCADIEDQCAAHDHLSLDEPTRANLIKLLVEIEKGGES